MQITSCTRDITITKCEKYFYPNDCRSDQYVRHKKLIQKNSFKHLQTWQTPNYNTAQIKSKN